MSGRCSACNRVIETSRYAQKKNNDLCAVCSEVVDNTIKDDIPEVFPVEYSFGGIVTEGLVRPKAFDN